MYVPVELFFNYSVDNLYPIYSFISESFIQHSSSVLNVNGVFRAETEGLRTLRWPNP
ncbi:hypothetical protein GCM10011391_39820 [Pullulanibacillus camelliae]|uniref:Uncharacterized protein n=1 Tax=Pullulanibacillus camelliae TaxID=1707096 RepID=A0A8J2YNS2_9BACL|nr:hypothetical protein GCM10011391_39820 [Pullulanibacillus camelliae]